MKFKVKVCDGHLPQFYEALKSGDLMAVKKIEHELSPYEECVACAYLLKSKGEAREEAEEFLAKEGLLTYVADNYSEKGVVNLATVRDFGNLIILGVVVLGLLMYIFLRSGSHF